MELTQMAVDYYAGLRARLDRGVQRGGPDECWPWAGARTTAGYGHFYKNGKHFYAHHLALALTGVSVLHALHTCDNPPCCNPAHLYSGGNKENARDRVVRGRQVIPNLRGEEHGMAQLTEEDVAYIRRVYQRAFRNRPNPYSATGLAEKYGVSRNHIVSIVRRKIWRHV